MPIATPASRTLQRRAQAAHAVLGQGGALDGLRPVVRDSWQRSLAVLPDPDHVEPVLGLAGPELAAYRSGHRLAGVMPVFERLLIQPARDTGLLVAVGDEAGRLLWVEGDPEAVRRAEAMAFVPGADWSERSVGTSAPGTALATGRGVQVSGAEHFSRIAHRWSCTAVPITCPVTGRILGVVDLTGNADAVAAHSLSLLHAAVAAAEAELRLQEPATASAPPPARGGAWSGGWSAGAGGGTARTLRLRVLGHDDGLLSRDGAELRLGGRHSEIMTLLAWHGGGLRADELAAALFGDAGQAVTLRAEMVRLRRALAAWSGPGAAPELASKPYRLDASVDLDARLVLERLAQGRHAEALAMYGGELLPRSEAPGIARIRAEVSAALRESVVGDAGPDELLAYLDLPEAADDADALATALQVLPRRSPHRAFVVARLERLQQVAGARRG
ncbi:GAF domain-containing protein [Zafaria sp. Z1313]|uniref:GAF domain-containing protein n=1 Tax=Zafaria sp. Z1313 TaxID=3423202 RepID=UPI003D301C86